MSRVVHVITDAIMAASIMSGVTHAFELQNALSELDTLCRNLETFGNALGLPKKSVFQINLALDELFTNIVSYGFTDEKTHRIKFTLSAENGVIIIRIEDSGIPFDTVSPDTSQVQPPVEDCKVGGLGLHLVKKMMDEVVYERCANKNVTTMKKKYLPET
jgi:serine/threonine-protein kinase RsbW